MFVALPGLTLARGRLDLCERVLAGALPFLRRGVLPNIYGRAPGDSHYGSCDAALWFALAVQRYALAGGCRQRVRVEFVPALRHIAEAYTAGTELGLRVDGDGLLLAGSMDLNATWMDARTSRGPVTPRAGLPVESLQRGWGTASFSAVIGPALIILLEASLLVLALVALGVWLIRQPGLLTELQQLLGKLSRQHIL